MPQSEASSLKHALVTGEGDGGRQPVCGERQAGETLSLGQVS